MYKIKIMYSLKNNNTTICKTTILHYDDLDEAKEIFKKLINNDTKVIVDSENIIVTIQSLSRNWREFENKIFIVED